MQPDLILTPFGENADPSTIRTIPETVSPSDPKQNASWSKGFPIATMTAISAGGVPPEGKDLNGVLNAISGHTVFAGGGGQYKWSSEYSSIKGGYSKGAVLQSDNGDASYVSEVDNNTINFNAVPESIGVQWVLYSSRGKVESIASLMAYKPTGVVGVTVMAYHPRSVGAAYGGGEFYYDVSRLRSLHDGINIFSPTVPYTWADFGLSYLFGVGETSPTARGCWIRTSPQINAFNAGAILNTNVTQSVIRLLAVMNGCAFLEGSFILAPDMIRINSFKLITGMGIDRTKLQLSAGTTGWGLLHRGNYSRVERLTFSVAPSAAFTGDLIRVENDGFNTYKQTLDTLLLKGNSGVYTGYAVRYHSDSDSGKGITFPQVNDIHGINFKSVLAFSTANSGFTDSGVFERIRGTFAQLTVEMLNRGACGSSSFKNVHGRYDSGVTLGLIKEWGTRNTYHDVLMYDFASPYIFIEPGTLGCILDSVPMISQGSSVQDKGWLTAFTGATTSVAPESSGGAGFGWLEFCDNGLGYNPSNKWNVVKTGSSTVSYSSTLAALGPMIQMNAIGAAGSAASIDFGSSYPCNPFQQSNFNGFFWITTAAADSKFECGLYSTAGGITAALIADISVNPNFYFIIKQPSVADVIIPTSTPVANKRHAFGIIRTGTSGGLTLYFDCLVIQTGVSFSEGNALLQPRIKITTPTGVSSNVYLTCPKLRTTSDTYVTDWVGLLN